MKKIRLLATGILALLLAAGSTSAFAGPSGIIAQGNFSVYKEGKLTNKISGINPVTEEVLLVCENSCLVKTKGIALIVHDGTEMAVKNGQGRFLSDRSSRKGCLLYCGRSIFCRLPHV